MIPADAAMVDPATPSKSQGGEYAFADAWGGNDSVGSELLGTLKALVEILGIPAPPKTPSPSDGGLQRILLLQSEPAWGSCIRGY